MAGHNGLIMQCAGCKRKPEEIGTYRYAAQAEETTPDRYVYFEEGTLNKTNGNFLCDGCYIAAGMPTAPGGWTCP